MELLEDDATVVWQASGRTPTFGWAIADVPDVDGDGVPEVLTGDPAARGNAGLAVVLSGRDGRELARLAGEDGSYTGFSLSGAGDQDGDGVADWLVAAPWRDRVLVWSGDGRVIRTLEGSRGDGFGSAVARVGDLDGDGVDDVAVGAEAAGDGGRVVVVAGGGDRTIWAVDGAPGDFLGSAAGHLGDVTGDGVPDVLVGARGVTEVRVLDGVDGSVVHALGDPAAVYLGTYFVSGVGDLDGDDVPDVYAGDYAFGPTVAGRAWVWSGRTGALHLVVDGRAGDGLGPGRYAGDVDGDGVGDLAIGAYTAGRTDAGRVTIRSGVDGRVLRTLTSTRPGENFGYDAVGLGDIDGDGAIDFAVSAAARSRVYAVGTAAPAEPEPVDPGVREERGCGCAGADPNGLGALAALALVGRRRGPGTRRAPDRG